MSAELEALEAMKMLLGEGKCVDCAEDWGPPPDNILSIPPPPFPSFVPTEEQNESALPHCSTCEWAPIIGAGATGVHSVEMTRQASATASSDAWLVLVSTSLLGVLLLGALLAIILLKCRSRFSKQSGSAVPHSVVSAKPAKGCDSVLYPYPVASQDGKVLWAAITARGTTQHFTAAVPIKPSLPPPEPPVTFDNTGFVDSDSQTPLMESYQLSELVDSDSTCSSGTVTMALRPRPHVSSPTRIEHPDLPPLNTLPHAHRHVRRAPL